YGTLAHRRPHRPLFALTTPPNPVATAVHPPAWLWSFPPAVECTAAARLASRRPIAIAEVHRAAGRLLKEFGMRVDDEPERPPAGTRFHSQSMTVARGAVVRPFQQGTRP